MSGKGINKMEMFDCSDQNIKLIFIIKILIELRRTMDEKIESLTKTENI